MKTMTARDLKNKTGEAMRTVLKGERVVVTLRGKPFALISPATEDTLGKSSLRNIDEAWNDIKDALRKTTPRFASAKEAMSWTRKRI